MSYSYNAKTGKVTDTKTGKSVSVKDNNNNLSKAIEKLKSNESSSNSKSSSSSKSKSTEGEVAKLAKQYGGYDKIPDYEYKKLAEKYNVESYKEAGAKSTYQGTIGGKVYTGLTEQEILENKINPNNPNVKLLTQATGVRTQNIEQEKRLNEAKQRYEQGKATTQDLVTLQSGGRTSLDLSQVDIAKTKQAVEQYSEQVRKQSTPAPEINSNVSNKIQLSKEQVSKLKGFMFDISGTQTEDKGKIPEYNEFESIEKAKGAVFDFFIKPVIKTSRAIKEIGNEGETSNLGRKNEVYSVQRKEGKALVPFSELSREEKVEIFGERVVATEEQTRPKGALLDVNIKQAGVFTYPSIKVGEGLKDPEVAGTLASPFVSTFKPIAYSVSALATGYFGAKTINELSKGEYEEAGKSALFTGLFATPLLIKASQDITKIKLDQSRIIPIEERRVVSDITLNAEVKGGRTTIETEGGKFDFFPSGDTSIPILEPKIETSISFVERKGTSMYDVSIISKDGKLIEQSQKRGLFGLFPATKLKEKVIESKNIFDPDVTFPKVAPKLEVVREIDSANSLVSQKAKLTQNIPINVQTKGRAFSGNLEIGQTAYQTDYLGVYGTANRETFFGKVLTESFDVEIIPPKVKQFHETIGGKNLLTDNTKKYTTGKVFERKALFTKETPKEVGMPEISFDDVPVYDEYIRTTQNIVTDDLVAGDITRLQIPKSKLIFDTNIKVGVLKETPKLQTPLYKQQQELIRGIKIAPVNEVKPKKEVFFKSDKSVLVANTEQVASQVPKVSVGKVEQNLIPVNIPKIEQVFYSSTKQLPKAKLTPVPVMLFKTDSLLERNKSSTQSTGDINLFNLKDLPKIDIGRVQSPKSSQSQDIFLSEENKPRTSVINIQSPKSDSLLKQDLITEQEQQTNIFTPLPNRSNVPPTTPPLIIPIVPFPKLPSVEERNQAYNVYAKDKGKFVKVNDKPLSRRSALNEMDYYVDNTTARTGYIKETSGKPSEQPRGMFVSNKYKEKKDKYIEKSQFAINTRGELEGITLKGLKAKKQKSLWRY